MSQRRLRREDYTVGWVCALPVELTAAAEMLDEEHRDIPGEPNDTNLYTLGCIGGHNVVIACLPAGKTGNNSAAAVAAQMKLKFTSIRFGLMVGVGGGVPSAESDVRLGDVVVSQPYMGHGGVIQYDFGKTTPSGFVRTGFLDTPPKILLNALAKLQANHLGQRSELSGYLSAFDRLPKFTRDNVGPDVLFESSYNHIGGATCKRCSKDKLVERPLRGSQEIVVHYGTIASGNQVMRDGITREKLGSELGGVLCFEMEAAGLMDSFPCLVIRGICDYADSHKNKSWQPYAAATAAACAKEVLSVIPVAEVVNTSTVRSSMVAADGQIPMENQSHSFLTGAVRWVAKLISHTVTGIAAGIFTGHYAVDRAHNKYQASCREADDNVSRRVSDNPNENKTPTNIGSIVSSYASVWQSVSPAPAPAPIASPSSASSATGTGEQSTSSASCSRPSFNGWWLCSQCEWHNNPHLSPDRCVSCSHRKCSACYIYGMLGKSDPKRPASFFCSA